MQNKKNDILTDLTIENTNNDKLCIPGEASTTEKTVFEYHEEKQNTPPKKISGKYGFKYIIFTCKYMAASVSIFGILMIATNYSAYLDIAKEYLYTKKGQVEAKGLISSVEASNIKEKRKAEMVDNNTNIEEKNDGNKYSIKKLIAETNKRDINLDIEITPYENRIVIPKIRKNIPLIDVQNQQITGEDELNNIFMQELEKGVVRYPGTGIPGKNGNSFIFGHSSNFPWIKGDYNDVFALLDNVVYNDEVIVYYGQKKFTYKIRTKKIIKPGDVSVLKSSNNKQEITLMTCWPIGTTLKRLVVTGELVEES